MKNNEKKIETNDTKNPPSIVDFYKYQYKRKIWAAKVRRHKKG